MNIIQRMFGSNNNKVINKMFTGFNSKQMLLPPKQTTKDYLTNYADSPYLYSCINVIANGVASADVVAQKKLKNGKVKVVESQVLDLLKHPNTFQSQYEFVEMLDKLLELTGKCYIYIARNNAGIPVELWPISPLYMTIIPDENEYIKGYIYNATGQMVPLNVDEVMYINIADPYDFYNGIGPAQAASYSLEVEKYTNKWNRNFFYNSATPAGVIELADELSQEAYDRLCQSWDENYGGVNNNGKTAVIEKGTYKQIGNTIKDMDFVNLKGVTKDEILAAFGIPKTLLGMETGINRATAETAKSIFNENVIRPRLRKIEDKINNELVPLFDEDIEIKFKLEETKDPEFIVNTINQGVTNGYITPEEAKEQIFNLLGLTK